jgi:hypothetical protein
MATYVPFAEDVPTVTVPGVDANTGVPAGSPKSSMGWFEEYAALSGGNFVVENGHANVVPAIVYAPDACAAHAVGSTKEALGRSTGAWASAAAHSAAAWVGDVWYCPYSDWFDAASVDAAVARADARRSAASFIDWGLLEPWFAASHVASRSSGPFGSPGCIPIAGVTVHAGAVQMEYVGEVFVGTSAWADPDTVPPVA